MLSERGRHQWEGKYASGTNTVDVNESMFVNVNCTTHALAAIDRHVRPSCTRFSSPAFLPGVFECAMVVGKEMSCVCAGGMNDGFGVAIASCRVHCVQVWMTLVLCRKPRWLQSRNPSQSRVCWRNSVRRRKLPQRCV